MSTGSTYICGLLLALGAAGTVRADYASTVRAPAAQTFVTSIDATQPSARLVSVADLIEGQTGVFVRSRGGLGSFTSVSIRGSEANEVAVLVDGLPLTRATTGVIDLSSLSVAGLERVEIWRGVPPIDFGPEAVGGAINLVTRRGRLVPELRAAVGGGSFGARSASVGWSGSDGPLRIDLSAAYHGATGDFSYYDTSGTLFNHSDDRTSVRHNNDFNQGSVDATLAGRRWRAGVHGFVKEQGSPGIGLAGAEALTARLTSTRLLLDGAGDGRVGPFTWSGAAQLLYERSAFTSGAKPQPYPPNVSDADALTEGLYLRMRAPWGGHQRWLLLADGRLEERLPHDLLAPPQSGSASTRVIGGVGVEDELRWWGERLTVDLGLRLDGDHDRLGVAGPQAAPAAPASYVEPTGRVTVRWLCGHGVALRAAAGRFVRFPTLLELFGDGAFILAHPALKPETAWAGDLGGSIDGRWGPLRGALEAAFFGRAVDDTIVYLPGARAASAANLGPARMLGVELRASAALGRFIDARLDYTFVDARQDQGGGQIPGRPQHELTARLDAHARGFRVFYELSYVDRLFRDPANSAWVPARALHAIGGSFDRGWLMLSLELRNVADLRVVQLPAGGTTVPYPLVDYFDYPLPGRALYATLVFRK